jgi:hypothetical protein
MLRAQFVTRFLYQKCREKEDFLQRIAEVLSLCASRIQRSAFSKIKKLKADR